MEFYQKVEEELVMLEDGVYYYEPKGPGVLSAHILRKIADCLDDCNKEWQEHLDAHFDSRET